MPPTSGANPMPTSGMATADRSVTTRWLPWAEMPTPPPMTMPSMTGTIGLAIAGDAGVEAVLLGPERPRRRCADARGVVDGADVAAGAERPLAGAVDHDGGDRLVGAEAVERGLDEPDHLERRAR